MPPFALIIIIIDGFLCFKAESFLVITSERQDCWRHLSMIHWHSTENWRKAKRVHLTLPACLCLYNSPCASTVISIKILLYASIYLVETLAKCKKYN